MVPTFGTRIGFFLRRARFVTGVTTTLDFLAAGAFALAPRVCSDATDFEPTETVGGRSVFDSPGPERLPSVSYDRPLVFIYECTSFTQKGPTLGASFHECAATDRQLITG